MGGRGSSGKSKGGGGGSNIRIDTPKQAKEFINSLNTGDTFTMVSGNSEIAVTKTDSKRYPAKERGVSQDIKYTLSEGTVLKRMQTATSIRRGGLRAR